MQSTVCIPCQRPDLFQSSSGQKAGCNQQAWTHTGHQSASFNPHPARRPDAIARPAHARRQVSVSILIRPEGRMQSADTGRKPARNAVFQSSSGQKAGCNTRRQPRAGFWYCFNPHPARRPDAIWRRWSCNSPALAGFQSSSGQKAGCNKVMSISMLLMAPLFQSSSGQKAGCNLLLTQAMT